MVPIGKVIMTYTTRAKAKKWFRRNFPRQKIEKCVGNIFYLVHCPHIVCVRYYEFVFFNAYHPDADISKIK